MNRSKIHSVDGGDYYLMTNTNRYRNMDDATVDQGLERESLPWWKNPSILIGKKLARESKVRQLSPRTIFERILSSDAERTSRQEHFENDDSSYEEVTFGELIVSSDGLVEQKEVPKSHMEALKKDISDMRRANLRLEKTVEELKIQVEGLRNLNMKLLAADTRNQKFKSRIVDLLNELWRKIQQLESNGDNDKENQKMKPIECSKKSSSLANGQDFLDVLIGQINECENEVKQTLGHMNTFRDLIDQTGNVPS